MSTTLRSALTVLALPIFWANPAHADDAAPRAVAHLVTLAPSHLRVIEAEPSELPSSTHAEGTIYGVVWSDPPQPSNVVELDVKTGAETHRAPLVCSKILHEKSSVFAICGDEVVEMDRTLAPVTRYAMRRCPAGKERHDIKLVTDHMSRVVALYTCGGLLQLTIVDTTEHRVHSNVSTNLLPYDYRYADEQTQLYFHGANILGYVPGMVLGPYEIFALSPDQRRVSHTRVVTDMWLEDDGAHLHLLRDSEKTSEDITLSDQLATLSTAPQKARAPTPPPPPLPKDLGGDGIRYGFAQGDVAFYMTFTCCGSGGVGGLYAARSVSAE